MIAARTRYGLLSLCAGAALMCAPAFGQSDSEPLTMEAINNASIESVARVPLADLPPEQTGEIDPSIVRLQVLLDRAGASPGVIDGYDGENVRKAISTIEALFGLPVDGIPDQDVLGQLSSADDVVVLYQITQSDAESVTGPVPEDYSDMAAMEVVGYASVAEAVAEAFHMDEDLLRTLNPDAQFVAGEQIVVVAPGEPLSGVAVARIEADKAQRRVRAYDAEDRLIAAYPATIGSESTPSPSGTHTVEAIAPNPNYTYDPDNFRQGDNTERLIIPPGPNNPVGSIWIDLSEPGYGIHGTPEPALIDKTTSHGCIRLTNWDAEELATLVARGVSVTFIE